MTGRGMQGCSTITQRHVTPYCFDQDRTVSGKLERMAMFLKSDRRGGKGDTAAQAYYRVGAHDVTGEQGSCPGCGRRAGATGRLPAPTAARGG
ncbi:hypothetical protein GCM10010254_24010 [Streptomyces chromofuscus]|nr:hypothetical protein GCM10010254_24010 [Streptomyces chromofuscus]